jgi:predicted nucleic acid-binding protein
MRVFLDTNILLDVIQSRVGLVEESTAVIVLAEELDAKLFIAWHSLATIYYLIRRGRTEHAAMKEIDQILDWADIAPVNSLSAARARNLNFSDFEDAMQCVCAESCLADIIITRNTKDFFASSVPALAPSGFLTRYGVS